MTVANTLAYYVRENDRKREREEGERRQGEREEAKITAIKGHWKIRERKGKERTSTLYP
jgi:hypothetical protein